MLHLFITAHHSHHTKVAEQKAQLKDMQKHQSNTCSSNTGGSKDISLTLTECTHPPPHAIHEGPGTRSENSLHILTNTAPAEVEVQHWLYSIRTSSYTSSSSMHIQPSHYVPHRPLTHSPHPSLTACQTRCRRKQQEAAGEHERKKQLAKPFLVQTLKQHQGP